MFPIVLFATRLSGMGSDTLFMGVVRRPPPVNNEQGNVVRFWGTATGTILCCDSSVSDSFGFKPTDLLGQNFANLCTGNLEHVTRCDKAVGVLHKQHSMAGCCRKPASLVFYMGVAGALECCSLASHAVLVLARVLQRIVCSANNTGSANNYSQGCRPASLCI